MAVLYAGSTNVVYYTPRVDGVPVEGDTMAVTILDAAGDEVTIAGTPAWDAAYVNDDGELGAYTLVIEYDECTSTHIGTDWEFEWLWTYVVDAVTQTLSDYETVPVVKGSTAVPELTVGENTYVTLAEANAYMLTRIGAETWLSASDADNAAALIMATRRIDSERLRGIKYDDEQVLEFPRLMWGKGEQRYSEEHERYTSIAPNAGWIGEEEVPQAIKDAECEEALDILKSVAQTTDRIALQAQGVTSVRIGDFYETYGAGGRSAVTKTAMRSSDATLLMRPYLAGNAAFV